MKIFICNEDDFQVEMELIGRQRRSRNVGVTVCE